MPRSTRSGHHGENDDAGASPSVAASRLTVVMILAVAIWTWLDLRSTVESMVRVSEIAATSDRLDPARAGVAAWQLLPGVGPVTASRIARHRATFGVAGVSTTDDTAFQARRWSLDEVPGVGRVTTRRAASDLVHPSLGADR